jgi:tetratricopeptide (TPR) repeat protein
MPSSPELRRLAQRLSADPGSRAFAPLADGLRKLGDLDAARAIAESGVGANPAYLPGHLVLARIHRDRHDPDATRSALIAAQAIDARHPVVLSMLGELPGDSRDSGESISGADRAALSQDLHDPAVEPFDMISDEVVEAPLATESLAMLYRGQGHLDQALEVFELLAARDPENRALAARRDGVRQELAASHPRPFDAARSGGKSVREWLVAVAAAGPSPAPSASGYDAFFQASPVVPQSDTDLAAFQSWLRELER